jgi:hypothetical protein
LVHAQEVVAGGAVIVHVFLKALQDVGPRKTIVLHLLHYLLVYPKVVVVFIVGAPSIHHISSGVSAACSRSVLPHKVLVQHILRCDPLVFQGVFLGFFFLAFFLFFR